QAAQLVGRHVLDWSRGTGRAWFGLRKSSGTSGVKGHMALHLLHGLVDVAIQHRDRAKSLEVRQRLRAIGRAPTPFTVNGPEGHVGKNNDGRAAAQAGDIFLEPIELLRPKDTKAAGLEVSHVDQADEPHALVVEALPAAAAGAFAVTLQVALP